MVAELCAPATCDGSGAVLHYSASTSALPGKTTSRGPNGGLGHSGSDLPVDFRWEAAWGGIYNCIAGSTPFLLNIQ